MRLFRKCECGEWFVSVEGRGRPRLTCGKCTETQRKAEQEKRRKPDRGVGRTVWRGQRVAGVSRREGIGA